MMVDRAKDSRPENFTLEYANEDGWSDWIHPLENYKMQCCDCGLIHQIEFRIDAINQLNFRVKRND